MYPLPIAEYQAVRPLFQPLRYHAAIDAILAQDIPATVYVDDCVQPQSAFTWTGHRFMLTGSGDNPEFNASLRQFFAGTILPQGRTAGLELFALYYAPGWEPAIEQILGSQSPLPVQRQYYAWQALNKSWQEKLPGEFTLQEVNRALLDNRQLANRENLQEEMCSERASVDEFLDKSFGVCVLHADEIAGWCLSEYNTGDRCEIGIETVDGYRRRGLATALTCAFVERALALGYKHIGWDCFANNTPSVATALKAGFVHEVDYPAFLVWYDPVVGASMRQKEGNR